MIYETFLKDHLGNVRVMFADMNGDGWVDPNPVNGEVLQVDHFYPFGLRMAGLSLVPGVKNSYLFTGKEVQDELSLGWIDFGARMYDAASSRWNGVDALGERYAAWSPYNYVMGSPLVLVDPEGRDIWIYYNDAEGNRNRITYKGGKTYNGEGEEVDWTQVKSQGNFLQKVASSLTIIEMLGGDEGKAIISAATADEHLVEIQYSSKSRAWTSAIDGGIGTTLEWNSDQGLVISPSGEIIPAIGGLVNELSHHALTVEIGMKKANELLNKSNILWDDQLEFENEKRFVQPISRHLGFPTQVTHDGVYIFTDAPGSQNPIYEKEYNDAKETMRKLWNYRAADLLIANPNGYRELIKKLQDGK